MGLGLGSGLGSGLGLGLGFKLGLGLGLGLEWMIAGPEGCARALPASVYLVRVGVRLRTVGEVPGPGPGLESGSGSGLGWGLGFDSSGRVLHNAAREGCVDTLLSRPEHVAVHL